MRPAGPGYHRLATALKDSGEYVEAVSVLDSGLRVNADHPDLKALLATLRPLAERQEKERRGTMSRAERFKAEGNDHFKRAEFELAIEKYTKAIEAGGGKASDEVVRSCYNNRCARGGSRLPLRSLAHAATCSARSVLPHPHCSAACHQQLSAFQKVVEDCTAVLEYDVRGLRFACDGTTSYAGRACRDGRGRLTPLQPENTKALLRRGLALEALERCGGGGVPWEPMPRLAVSLTLPPSHPPHASSPASAWRWTTSATCFGSTRRTTSQTARSTASGAWCASSRRTGGRSRNLGQSNNGLLLGDARSP